MSLVKQFTTKSQMNRVIWLTSFALPIGWVFRGHLFWLSGGADGAQCGLLFL